MDFLTYPPPKKLVLKLREYKRKWRCTEFNHCFTLLIFLLILGQENSSIPENEFADFVDTILQDRDYDDDGFIDYPEFVRSFQQHREGPE